MHSGIQPTTPISTTLCFSEWDYYLDSYDVSHPSGFFTYDIGLFHSLIQEIDYSQIIQHAKSKLYGLEYRPKMFWADEFYALFREIMLDIHQFDISMSREQVLNKL
jgi:hypothetical protein